MKFFKGLLIGLAIVLPLWIGVIYASAADIYFFEPSSNAEDSGMSKVTYNIWAGDKLDAMVFMENITGVEWTIDRDKVNYGDFIQASAINEHGESAKNIAVEYLNLNIPFTPGKGGIKISQTLTSTYQFMFEDSKPWWQK